MSRPLLVLGYYKMYNTVIEMLVDRGYKKEILTNLYKMDIDKFQDYMVNNKLNIEVEHEEEKRKAIVVFYGLQNVFKLKGEVGKIKKEEINLIISDIKNTMDTEYNYNVILVLKDKPHNMILNKIADIHSSTNIDEYEKKMFVEYFLQDELKYNVSRHELVPRHTKCTKDEISQLLKKYNITLLHLPKILHTDPQARYLGLRTGDVCKIERISDTTGIYIYYRLVV